MRAKVIHIIGTMDMGGAENFLIHLLSELNQNIYDSKVYYLVGKGSLAHKLTSSGIPCESLNAKGQKDILKIPKLLSIFLNEQPQIVHTHVHVANYWIGLACKLAGVPILIQTIQDTHQHVAFKLPIVRFCQKINNLFATKIIAVSENVRNHLIQEFGAAESKTMTIYNGISVPDNPLNQTESYTRKEFGLSSTDFIVGCVANLVPEKKGYEYLLPAFARAQKEIPNLKLLTIGDGPLRDELSNEIQKLNISKHVCMLGQRKDVYKILPLFDIFVLASLYEGTPLAIIEAMLFKKAIVATTVGGIPEIVQDNFTGLLVASKNIEALKDAMVKLYHDKALRDKLGQNGYERAIYKFTMDKIAVQVHNLYQNLLAENCSIHGF